MAPPAAVAALAALASCGGDERSGDRPPAPVKPPPSQTPPGRAGDDGEPEPRDGAREPGGSTPTAPAPGGEDPSGEEPVRTEVELRARGGGVRPARVRVAPFVAVRLTLRRADAGRYSLAVGTRRLAVDAARPVAALTLRGLPAGGRHVARPVEGLRNGVTIVASAEPGP